MSQHGHSPNFFYKTLLCRDFLSPGGCASGLHCGYAHGNHELRIATGPTYKTKPCMRALKNGFCQYGDRCVFLHPEEYKIRDCPRLKGGFCPYGARDCVFRHPEDLLTKKDHGHSSETVSGISSMTSCDDDSDEDDWDSDGEDGGIVQSVVKFALRGCFKER